jgi:hypothetical protein
MVSQILELLAKQYPSILLALGAIIGAGWIIEQYYGYKTRRQLLCDSRFLAAVGLVVLATAGYHAWDRVQRRVDRQRRPGR